MILFTHSTKKISGEGHSCPELISHHPRGTDDLKTGNAWEWEGGWEAGDSHLECVSPLWAGLGRGVRGSRIFGKTDRWWQGCCGNVHGKDRGYLEVGCRAAELLSWQGYQLPHCMGAQWSCLSNPRPALLSLRIWQVLDPPWAPLSSLSNINLAGIESRWAIILVKHLVYSGCSTDGADCYHYSPFPFLPSLCLVFVASLTTVSLNPCVN